MCSMALTPRNGMLPWPIRTFGSTAPQSHDVDARMSACVFGPALGGKVLHFEPATCQRVAHQPRAIFIRLAGRVEGGDANERGREVDDFIGGGFDRREHPVDVPRGGWHVRRNYCKAATLSKIGIC